MTAQSRPARGRPLVFLASVVLIWVAARSVVWLAPEEPEAPEAPPMQLAVIPAGEVPLETPTKIKVVGSPKAVPPTLVEGLEAPPSAHEHGQFIDRSIAAGHDMLWMSASQETAGDPSRTTR